MIASYPMAEIRGRVELRNLRAWRLAKGMTQEELAKKSGVNRTTLTRLENQNNWAYGATIKRLARALRISEQQLVNELPQ